MIGEYVGFVQIVTLITQIGVVWYTNRTIHSIRKLRERLQDTIDATNRAAMHRSR